MSYAVPTTGDLTNGTLDYDPASDFLGAEANQIYANWLIGPITIGQGIQIYLSGIALALSIVLWHRKTGSISTENKVFLIIANVVNSGCAILALVTFYQYGVEQNVGVHLPDLCGPFLTDRVTEIQRSYESFYDYSSADAIQPFFQGLSGFVVQVFFVRRLQKFLGKIWVAFVLYPLVFATMVGATLTTISNFLYMEGIPAGLSMLLVAPQLWLWTAAATDCTISLILSISLWRNKPGFAKRTEKIVNRVIRFSMGTAAVTTVTAVLGAITYVAFYNDIRTDVYYVFTSPLPSIYLFTLIYACSGWGRETNSPGHSTTGLESGGQAGEVSKASQPPRTPSSGQRTRGERGGDDMDAYVHWSPIAREAFARNIGPGVTSTNVTFVALQGHETPEVEKPESEAAERPNPPEGKA